jgi:hypothetical protein
MSNIWESLIDVCNFYIDILEKSGIEYKEDNMERFNNNGWVNRTWKSSLYRRAHIDVVDARETKGLWMMHCCIFPHLTDSSPIFGFDVIAGKNKITGCFIDYSPTIDKNHKLLTHFETMVSQYEWKKVRELPDWAKRIFSENMVAASNINDSNELENIVSLAKDSIVCYINNLTDSNDSNKCDVIKSQEYYGFNQRQNPHTPRTMTALGLSPQDVDYFVNNCLFPSIQDNR